MGAVLEAWSPAGQRVALKVARPVGAHPERAALRARLLREARILGKLDLPGAVRLVDSGEVDGLAYVAMEYIESINLDHVRAVCPLDSRATVHIGLELANTLRHMHAAGVVHRDVKPGNVLIARDGRIVLADFGIARDDSSAPITRAGELVGSLGYVAPECLNQHPPGPASDQYALGRLLLEVAATRPPASVPAHLPFHEQFQLAAPDWARLPAGAAWTAIRSVLQRMCASDPRRRYDDLAAAGAALEGVWRAVIGGARISSGNLSHPAHPMNPALCALRDVLQRAAGKAPSARRDAFLVVETSSIVLELRRPAPPPLPRADAVKAVRTEPAER